MIALLFNQGAYSIVSAGDLLLNCSQAGLPEGKLHILGAKVRVMHGVCQINSEV